VLHHRGLVERRQLAQVDRAVPDQAGEALAVERRVRRGVAHELVDPRALVCLETLARQRSCSASAFDSLTPRATSASRLRW
jgi:hypothetical protein